MIPRRIALAALVGLGLLTPSAWAETAGAGTQSDDLPRSRLLPLPPAPTAQLPAAKPATVPAPPAVVAAPAAPTPAPIIAQPAPPLPPKQLPPKAAPVDAASLATGLRMPAGSSGAIEKLGGASVTTPTTPLRLPPAAPERFIKPPSMADLDRSGAIGKLARAIPDQPEGAASPPAAAPLSKAGGLLGVETIPTPIPPRLKPVVPPKTTYQEPVPAPSPPPPVIQPPVTQQLPAPPSPNPTRVPPVTPPPPIPPQPNPPAQLPPPPQIKVPGTPTAAQPAATAPTTQPETKLAKAESPAGPAPLGRVLFDPASSDLSPPAQADVAKFARDLTSNEAMRVTVMGYAASAGADPESASQSRRLSLFRALEVRKQLIAQGVRSTRIDVRPLGGQSSDGPPDRVDIVANPS